MLERKTVSQCITADYCWGWNDAVDAMPKWISVEEMLPEELGVVLGVMMGTVTLLFYVGDGEFRTGNGMLWEKGCGYITHWMPLPPVPEEEKC